MRYKNPAAAVDLIIQRRDELLLIKRKHSPYKGYYALPGGFLNYGEETLEQAAIRELEEETGLIARVGDLELVGVYSSPNRDPRGHVITHVYIAKVKGKLKAGDDAKEAGYFLLDNLPSLAFDHSKIILDYEKGRK